MRNELEAAKGSEVLSNRVRPVQRPKALRRAREFICFVQFHETNLALCREIEREKSGYRGVEVTP